MNLKEVMKYLVDNQYVVKVRGNLVFSRKFKEEYTEEKPPVEILSIGSVAIVPKPAKMDPGGIYYADRFIQFSMDCQAPKKIAGPRGTIYPGNKYNEKAAITLLKMLKEEGVDYDLLVKSTMLYYKGAGDCKKALGNYILEGTWRTDYLELKNSAEKGVEALGQHIKTTLDNGEHSLIRIG